GLGRLPGAAIDMLALPDFSRITSPVSLGYIVVFASIGSLESTLGVLADPARRGSNLDRDLLVVGLGNLVCAAIGGLPMVSQPVRGGSGSKDQAAASSRRADVVHGLLLLATVALIPAVIEHVPLAA